MSFIFGNRTIFWDISKWNRGQKKWDGGSIYIYIYMTLHGFKFKTTNPSYPPVHLEPKLLNKFSCDFKVPTFFFFLKKTVKKKR